MSKWVRRNEQPCNMDIMLRVSLIDARKKEEQSMKLTNEEDFYSREETFHELERIKKRYNIEIDEKFFNSDPQLFKSFMSMNTNAFYRFKNNSDISRTLIQSNFKPKKRIGIEKRTEAVMKAYELD